MTMKIYKSYLKSLTFFFCFFLINNNLLGQITNQKVPTVDDQRKIQQNPTLKKSPQEIFKEPLEEDQIKKEEMKIILKKINFDGNTIFTTEKLQEVVKNFINIEIDLKDLQNISKELSFFYKSQGYWANAVIPEQDIKNQELLVRIYEGKVGKFIIKKDEKDIPISEDKLFKYLQNNLEKDQVLRIDQLDTNLKIINSIPGVLAVAELEAGDNLGETDIVVQVVNKSLFDFFNTTDNFGSRSSGYNRNTALIYLNNTLGIGEQFGLQSVNTQGSEYFAINNSYPLGYDGTRINLKAAKMEYKLRAPYSSTAPSGFSTEFSTSITTPFIQSTKTNLSSSLAVSKNKYVNDLNTGNSSKKYLDKLSLSLNFDRRDNFFEEGINYGFIEFSVGELNLRGNITNHDTDQLSTRNAGNSRVANLNINRLQKIDDNYFLSVKFKGQYSADNLDGAEQFSLGGSNGVRAYPNNEGAGAMGYLTTVEIKRLLGNNIEAGLFYDYGRTMLYKFLWTDWNAANTAISNNYSLEGYGVSLDWNIMENVKLNFLHARKLGSNQGKDTSGNDSDGLSKDRRTLLSLNLSF